MPKLDEATRTRLIEAAMQAQKNAYIPYSNFPVGAALLATDGTIFTGCNIENASFSATICAERTAVVKAVSEGVKKFTAVAVATNNGVFPCGVCRQVLNEFSDDMVVITVLTTGELVTEVSLSVLLPGSFGQEQLSEGQHPQSHGTE
jgi:cytidine deaminase